MKDFACNKLNINDVIKCSLGLTKAEFLIFRHLIDKKEECSTTTISEKKSLDISTVQRTLKKLVDKGIVSRRQINLESGGYEFAYKIKDKKQISQKIISIINEWSKQVEDQINKWKKE